MWTKLRVTAAKKDERDSSESALAFLHALQVSPLSGGTPAIHSQASQTTLELSEEAVIDDPRRSKEEAHASRILDLGKDGADHVAAKSELANNDDHDETATSRPPMKASDYSLAIVPLLPERRRSLPMATNQVRAAPGEHEASGLTPEWGDKLKEMRQRRRSSLSDRVRQSPTDGKELLKGTSAATTTEGESDAGTEQLTARVKTWLHRRRSSADQRGDTLSRSRLKQQEPRELPPSNVGFPFKSSNKDASGYVPGSYVKYMESKKQAAALLEEANELVAKSQRELWKVKFLAPEERIERIRAAATQNIASDDAAKLRSLWSSTTPCEEAQKKGAPSQATDEVAQTIPLQTKLSSEGRLNKRKMTKVAVGSRIKSKTKQKNEKKKRMVAEWKAAKAAAAEEAKASAAARAEAAAEAKRKQAYENASFQPGSRGLRKLPSQKSSKKQQRQTCAAKEASVMTSRVTSQRQRALPRKMTAKERWQSTTKPISARKEAARVKSRNGPLWFVPDGAAYWRKDALKVLEVSSSSRGQEITKSKSKETRAVGSAPSHVKKKKKQEEEEEEEEEEKEKEKEKGERPGCSTRGAGGDSAGKKTLKKGEKGVGKGKSTPGDDRDVVDSALSILRSKSKAVCLGEDLQYFFARYDWTAKRKKKAERMLQSSSLSHYGHSTLHAIDVDAASSDDVPIRGDGMLTFEELRKAVRLGFRIPPAQLPDENIRLLLSHLDAENTGAVPVTRIASFIIKLDEVEVEEEDAAAAAAAEFAVEQPSDLGTGHDNSDSFNLSLSIGAHIGTSI